MKGIHLAQQAKVVPMLHPISGTTVSDLISLKKHQHASIILVQGVAACTCTMTIHASDDAASTNTSAIPFAYYQETTSGIDILAAKATAAVAGITITSGSNQYLVVELDASELPSGKPFVGVNLTTADSNVAVLAVLTGARYAEDEAPTVQA